VSGRLARCSPHVVLGVACVGLALANGPRVGGPGAAAFAGSGLAVALARRSPVSTVAGAAVALLAAGWWWGSTRADSLDRSVLAAYVDRGDVTRLVVTGPPHVTPFGVRVLGKVERFGALRVHEPVLAELPPGRAPPQGARLRLIALIRAPRGPRNGFDERAWLARQGIHVVLRGERWHVIGRRGGIGGVSDRLRAWLLGSSAPGLHGERRAVVDGIVVGADEGLTSGLKDSFRASGLYHLLAVSGQNVVFLGLGVFFLAWVLGVSRLWAEVAVLGVIAAYTLAVGWQPSVVRAAVAGSLASLAWLTSRLRDRWYFLLLGAAVLLAWNPYSLRDPGFQLSFAAVVAIFLLVPPLERVLEGYPVPRRLVAPLAVSAACGLLTAPVLWLEFGAVPLYSVLANALAEPAVGPLLALGLLAALLHPVVPAASYALAWLNGWCAAYLAAVARAVAALPSARVTSSRAILVGLLGAMAATLVVRARREPGAPR
jgi:competence protein ComEC